MPQGMPVQDTGETSGGLMPSVAGNIGWIGLARTGISSRTMMYGTTQKSGAFYRWAGFRHTPEEVRAWQQGRFAMTGMRNPAWRAMDKSWDLGGKGIVGTPYAPSTWTSTAIMSQDPTKYTNFLGRLSIGELATESSLGSPLGKIPKFTDQTFADTVNQTLRLGSASTKQNAFIQDFLSGIWMEDPIKQTGKSPLFHSTQRGSARMRSGAAKGTVSRSHMGIPLNQVEAQAKVYERMASRGGVRGFFGERMLSGQTRRVVGATAEEVAAGKLFTPFAVKTSKFIQGGGFALRAYGWVFAGQLAGKGIYKAGEAFYYKMPKHMASTVGTQLMRPTFTSSADASLLTGIPANNRMRAVQAIQGSRLNARSALGSEASAMAGHFG